MTAATFVRARARLGPKWLVEGDDADLESEQVGVSLDVVKDAFVERLRLGHIARFPQNDPDGTAAVDDALVAIGRDRRVVRGLSETPAAYAVRLLRWLDERRTAGNPFTLMRQLAAYLGPLPSFRTVDCRGNWFSRSAAGVETSLLNQGNWNWDGLGATLWSRFWVIIYPGGLWTSTAYEWGAVTVTPWGDAAGHPWGLTITPEEVSTLRFLVRDWKPAGTRCVSIIVAFDAASFNPASPPGPPLPDGTWAKWGKIVAGEVVPARLGTARYLDGS